MSIPFNTTEMAASETSKVFLYFLNIVLGSLAKLETQLTLSREFGYITKSSEIKESTISVRKLFIGLKKHIFAKR